MRAPLVTLCVLTLAAVLGACEKETPAPARPREVVPAKPKPAASGASAAAELPKAPPGFEAMPVPESNPLTPAKVKLGNQLFFDKRLSVDGSRACYSCHLNEDGTGGHDAVAVGPGEKKLTRHAPTMWNVGYLGKLYWDGRSDSLEAQAMGALTGGNMGVPKDKLADKAKEIEAVPGYKALFDDAFPGEGVTPETITKALASYERTLYCGNTAWDRFNAGQTDAMTDEQQKGWKVFTGKGMCNQCHTPPMFSDAYASKDGAFHNSGRGIEGKKEEEVDQGRGAITKAANEWAAFKTPSLRNVVNSAPYFHDGSVPKLEDAVRFMASGGKENKNRDAKLADRKLTDDEVKQLIAFFGALSCPDKLVEPKAL